VKLALFWTLLRNGRMQGIREVGALSLPFQRLCFLAAAESAGVLRALAAGPAPAARLAAELGIAPAAGEAFAAWLEVGARLGALRRVGEGFALRSRLARRLARPEHDALAAHLTEIASLHHALLTETPERLRAGRRFQLGDQDGVVIARASRLLEDVVHEAIDSVVPRRGALRLLEIGCGSGTHVRRAAERNPELTALALELQPEVAAEARRNLAAWGLAGRIEVEPGDVRARAPEPAFDLATLHQNIYYFPVEERAGVLSHVRGFLRPGGRLLVTTGCRSRTPAMSLLDLWGALTEGCGRLPEPEELVAQLRQADFQAVRARNLLAPCERFYAFVATA
jgi:SAM-dependent methyltransferase